MTEREYLATLSDEELAEKLQDECCLCTFQNRTNVEFDATDNVEDFCKKGILLFLKSEHREMKRCPCCGDRRAGD